MAQAFPVLLVIRNSEGEVRWMDVREREREKAGEQIDFEGERFDVMSVRQWRDGYLERRSLGVEWRVGVDQIRPLRLTHPDTRARAR